MCIIGMDLQWMSLTIQRISELKKVKGRVDGKGSILYQAKEVLKILLSTVKLQATKKEVPSNPALQRNKCGFTV